MDTTTCLKSLLLAVRQHRNHSSAATASQLRRQISLLSGFECCRFLISGQVLPSECLSGLLDVAGDPKSSPGLAGSIISLLAQMASDDEVREALHSSYNVTSTLASIIHCNRATPEEPLVLQCLQVLQKVTYNVKILPCTSYIDELINFLMQNIKSCNDEMIKPCLGLMANLCRHISSVQTHVKSQSNVKVLYRSLIDLLAHNSLTVVIYALSILASLTLNEQEGQKLFNAENIHQTFPLIFNITINGDGTLTRNYAVDLLVDLLKNAKIADHLTNYRLLPECLSEVLGLLHSKDPETAAKVLELLVALCSVPGLRRILCETTFCSFKPRLQPRGRKGGTGRPLEPGVALLQWSTRPLQASERCYLRALDLTTQLFVEAISSHMSGPVHSFADLLLPALLGLLQPPEGPEESALLKKHCVRMGRVMDLLLVLSGDDFLKTLVSKQLKSELCVSQVELLLSSTVSSNCPATDSLLSQVSSEALLKTLELMSCLKHQVLDMETCFYQILQDQRIVTPLSLAITSSQREHVQAALRILFEAAPLPDFPSIVLGDSIAANNSCHQREAELCGQRPQCLELRSSGKGSSVPANISVPSRQNIDALIEKLQNSMEENMKDIHMSEVIDVYEQKISALASKEAHLEDLLEAKCLAVAQADRLIAQYRCQRAQAEAEARKLAGLLKEAELRKEDVQQQLDERLLEVQRVKMDVQQLLQHNDRLQSVSEEHQTLKGAYNGLLNRYNDNERLLKELQAAHVSLTQQAENLKRTNEALRLQQDRILAEVSEKEKRIEHLNAESVEKDERISDLQGALKRDQDQISEMEGNVSVLRKELNKMEQARKDVSIKASSLELQKVQLETKLQKKEEELNKNMQMIAMIHSLSSAKAHPDTANVSL
ncbi:protein CIP2A isoform X2 [Denticeps clupeoides]|uniref:protein CIP2A isoform X2 n=1 Tax=Denticeps clupeoides TaxID=299321 RepID=UPI0010A42190|nr:protein CIP2A isoform X2 [Denticeps clupeoides]